MMKYLMNGSKMKITGRCLAFMKKIYSNFNIKKIPGILSIHYINLHRTIQLTALISAEDDITHLKNDIDVSGGFTVKACDPQEEVESPMGQGHWIAQFSLYTGGQAAKLFPRCECKKQKCPSESVPVWKEAGRHPLVEHMRPQRGLCILVMTTYHGAYGQNIKSSFWQQKSKMGCIFLAASHKVTGTGDSVCSSGPWVSLECSASCSAFW